MESKYRQSRPSRRGRSLAIFATSKALATTTMLKEWRLRQTLELHTGDVNGCDFSGTTLATCSNDKTVRIWNLDESGRFVESAVSPLTGHKYGVNAVQFSLLGTILASCSIDGTVMLWNAQVSPQPYPNLCQVNSSRETEASKREFFLSAS